MTMRNKVTIVAIFDRNEHTSPIDNGEQLADIIRDQLVSGVLGIDFPPDLTITVEEVA